MLSVDFGDSVILVLFDLSAAFDTVGILIIRSPSYLWCSSRLHFGSNLVFSVYALGYIFRKHAVSFHFYADDTQIYLLLKHNDKKGLETLLAFLADTRSWMPLNF